MRNTSERENVLDGKTVKIKKYDHQYWCEDKMRCHGNYCHDGNDHRVFFYDCVTAAMEQNGLLAPTHACPECGR